MRMASGSDDGTIKLWNLKENVCVKTIQAHNNGVTYLKSLNANTLVSTSFRDIKVWHLDSAKSKCVQNLIGHTNWVRYIIQVYNGDGVRLASCSDDMTIKVWDLEAGTCLQTIAHTSKMYCLLLLPSGDLASGSHESVINIWSLNSGTCVKTLRGHSKYVWRLLALPNGGLASCSADNTVKIWNVDSATCTKTFVGHNTSVTAIRVRSANNTLVSGSDNGLIKVWSLDTGYCVDTIVAHKDMGIKDLI